MMVWDKQEEQEAFIARVITGAPKTLYDIGVGPKTEYLTLKKLYPNMDVFGCEPLVDQYPGLRERFNGKLFGVGLSDKAGEAKISFNPKGVMQASMLKSRPGDERLSISTITLDEFDEACGAPERILLWADIEGMEYRMLRSGPELLASGRIKWINLEEHRTDTKQNKKIEKLLARFDYERVIEYNKHPKHQDVIYVHESERRS
jgi:FkbM family methyltransferase